MTPFPSFGSGVCTVFCLGGLAGRALKADCLIYYTLCAPVCKQSKRQKNVVFLCKFCSARACNFVRENGQTVFAAPKQTFFNRERQGPNHACFFFCFRHCDRRGRGRRCVDDGRRRDDEPLGSPRRQTHGEQGRPCDAPRGAFHFEQNRVSAKETGFPFGKPVCFCFNGWEAFYLSRRIPCSDTRPRTPPCRPPPAGRWAWCRSQYAA